MQGNQQKVGFFENDTLTHKWAFKKSFLKIVAMWLQMPRKVFLRGISTYSNTFLHCLRPGFVTKVIACSYDTYWLIYARKSTKSWIFTNSMSKIDLDFGRISETSFFPNRQSLMPSRKKLVCHIKKRKAVQGVTTRWSIQNRKNYNDSSHRSICGGINVLSRFDAYLRI